MDKKEAKFAYKSTLRPMGVFQIRDTVNGRVLVGASLNLDGRKNRFAFEVASGHISNNAALKQDWDQHGPANFTFEILDQIAPVDDPNYDYRADLATLEQLWLEKIQPYGERGYNSPPR